MTENTKSFNPDAAPGDIADYLKKKAAFMQHSLPGLLPGKYHITAHEELTSGQSAGLPPTFAPVSRTFGVTGARYKLDPNMGISVFPPIDEASEYSTSLAHAVMEQEKFPWLRSPYSPKHLIQVQERVYTDSTGGKHPYDDDVPTWLTVMLLSAGDFPDGSEPMRMIKQGTVQDLVPSTLQLADPQGNPINGTLDTTGYSIFSYRLEPDYASEKDLVDIGIGSKATDSIAYIDIPAALFNILAPTLNDLSLMAHVREVVMTDKPIASSKTVTPEKSYSLVMSNRLPASFPKPTPGTELTADPQGKNTAFLISLENMDAALPQHTGSTYYDATISTNSQGFVRLIVLKNWSFTSWFDDSAAFVNLLKGLNGRAPDSSNQTVPVPTPLIRMPQPIFDGSRTDDEEIIKTLFALGYIALNHVTRVPNLDGQAVQTVSWYRGPLIPFKKDAEDSELPPFIDATTGKPTVYSSDRLLRFDPNVGMYDVSYAAAWQLGRLIALNDKAFSVPLYQWRKKIEGQYRGLVEGQALRPYIRSVFQMFSALRAASPQGQTTLQNIAASADLLEGSGLVSTRDMSKGLYGTLIQSLNALAEIDGRGK